MVDLTAIEERVDAYVARWSAMIPGPLRGDAIIADNQDALEKQSRVFTEFRDLEQYDHQELLHAGVLLTRSLRGQLNQDHRFLWAWTVCIAQATQLAEGRAPSGRSLFKSEWIEAFKAAANLALADVVGAHQAVATLDDFKAHRKRMDEAKDVANRHLLAIPASKYQLGAALAFPILEGALARKNRAFVHADGRASQALEVPDAAEKTGKKKFGHNGRVNRLKHQLRIFEVYEVARRGRAASWLVPLYDEIALLAGAPKRDIPEAIDAWRNALLHGNSYWTAKFASMMNLISMLVLDELDPGEYRTHRAKAVSTIAFMGPEWPFFVPDVR